MFSPYDESNHAGLLTGMSRRALGLAGPPATGQEGTLTDALGVEKTQPKAGKANPKKHAQQVQKMRAIRKLTDADVAAYMQQPFSPPGAGSTPEQQALFVAARSVAEKSPQIVQLRQQILLAAKGALDTATTEQFRVEAQAVVDNFPKTLKEAEEAFDVAMQPLVTEAEKFEADFHYFIDWVQSCVKEIADLGSDDDDDWAEDLWESGKLDRGQGQVCLDNVKEALYHVWEEPPYKGDGPPLKLLPDANPPFIYKGKAIAGTEAGYYVKWTAWTQQDLGISVTSTLKFQPIANKATHLRSVGASANAWKVPGNYLPAHVWNSYVYERAVKMAALWQSAKMADTKVNAAKFAFKKAQETLAKVAAIKVTETSPEKQLESLRSQSKKLQPLFLQGYADALCQHATLVGKLYAEAVTWGNKLVAADKAYANLPKLLPAIEQTSVGLAVETNPQKKAKDAQQALALCSEVLTQLDQLAKMLESTEQTLKGFQEQVKTIEGLGAVVDQSYALPKRKAGLQSDAKKIQEMRAETAKQVDLATKLQAKLKVQAEEALKEVGVKEVPKDETPPPPPVTTQKKSSIAVPLAVGILGIAAALRGR